jgi:hypothetical protein
MFYYFGTKLSLIFAVAALTAGAAQKQYKGDYYHPKLKGGEITIRRVIVFPPSLQLQKNTMKGVQSMEKESEDVVPMLDRAIVRALENSHVAVSEVSPTEALLASNPAVLESVANEQRSFDSISPALFRRLKDVRKGRFKLPQDALESKWNEEQKSDTLVFIRGFGGRETKAKTFASGGGLLGMAFAGELNMNLLITFVDANSEEVLLAKGFFVTVKKKETETKLEHQLDGAFKPDRKNGIFGTT